MIKAQPLSAFITGLSEGSATVGGGAAAALMGAMSAALASMVLRLTLARQTSTQADAELQQALQRADALSVRLTDLIQADADAYHRVTLAYAMAQDNPQEKTARSEAIQRALKGAADVPLACAELAREVLSISQLVAEKGNRNAISESGISGLLAYAALHSCALNVRINLAEIRDAAFTGDRQQQLAKLLAGSEALQAAIIRTVNARL